MATQRRRGGFALPLVLVALGIILLLNNLGCLSWQVWEHIGRLWPILLIAIGVDLMIGRGAFRWWLALLVFVAILACAGLVLLEVVAPGAWATTEESISQALQGASRAEVELSCNACALRLGPLLDSENLIEGEVAHGWGENLRHRFQVLGDTAYFTLESKRFIPPSWLRRSWEKDWFLQFNPDVPMDLKVTTGVGRSSLNLESLTITDLELKTGAGETIVTLPNSGRFQAEITSESGEMVVRIPEGLGVRVEVKADAGKIDVPGDYARQDDTYISPNYESAAHRVDLKIRSDDGEIVIEKKTSI